MKDSERIKRMQNYMKSTCRACGDPIHVCNDNPDTNHYELVVNDKGKIIGETERIFGDKKLGGVKGEDKNKPRDHRKIPNKHSMLKLRKEMEDSHMKKLSDIRPLPSTNEELDIESSEDEKKDMFNLAEFKPDDFVKDTVTYECLTENAMTFLELASEKAFELLDEVYDDDDDEIKELKCLFLETKTSLSASMDTRNN